MFTEAGLTPFSVGFLGGALTGLLEPSSRWHRLGPYLAFFAWLLVVAFGFLSESSTPGTLTSALAVAVVWGGVPFALSFVAGRAVTGFLRKLIV